MNYFGCSRLPLVGAALGMALSSFGVAAAAIDLRTWTAESYPAVAGFSAGDWTTASDGTSVTQSVNGQPTLFVSDFNAFGTDVRGTIQVNRSADDDFVGFAIGYRAGDASNTSADYLLVDWKKADQFYDFGDPSTTPGSKALAGLAVSRVSGIPTADEFWGHVNFDADGNGLQELARGLTLGSTGWKQDVAYEFQFVFQPNALQVYVDKQLELSISGSFSDGRMAFYNFSQGNVSYSAFTLDPLPPVPEPGTWALMLGGLFTLAGLSRRRMGQRGS
jgi:hypothetical protein